MFDVVMCVHNMSFHNKPAVNQTQYVVVKVSAFIPRQRLGVLSTLICYVKVTIKITDNSFDGIKLKCNFSTI